MKRVILLILYLLSFDLSAQMGMSMQASLVSQSYNYSSAYRTALNYAAQNGISPPFLFVDRKREDTFLRAFPLSTADQFFFMTTYGDASWALLNMKSPGTKNGSLSGTYIYTQGKGFSTQALTAFINTNFTPSTDGVNYTQNSGGIITYCPSSYGSRTDNIYGSAGASNANAVALQLSNGSGNLSVQTNAATANTVANASTTGLYHIERTSSTNIQVFKNASSILSTTRTTTGLSANPIYLGANNNNGTANNQQYKYVGFWAIGANWNGQESAINTAWSNYLSSDTQYSVSLPTFPSYSTYTNDLASYQSAIASSQQAFSIQRPSVELLMTTITGSSLQYQGLTTGSNGILYGIPSSGTNILRIDPTTDAITQILSGIAAGSQKFGSGCLVGNLIIMCPYNATAIGVLDTSTETITYYDTSGAVAGALSGNLTGSAKWWGCYLGSDGLIYFIAYNQTEVMVFNPTTHAIYFLDTTGVVSFGAGNLTGLAKWDSGTSYGDYVYGSSSTATDMCKIDIAGQKVFRVASVGAGTNKYSIMNVMSNKILMQGYNNSDNQIFDPSNNSLTTATGTYSGSSPYEGFGTMGPNGQMLINEIDNSTFWTFNESTSTMSAITGWGSTTANTLFWQAVASNGSTYFGVGSGSRFYKINWQKMSVSPSTNFRFSRYNAK